MFFFKTPYGGVIWLRATNNWPVNYFSQFVSMAVTQGWPISIHFCGGKKLKTEREPTAQKIGLGESRNYAPCYISTAQDVGQEELGIIHDTLILYAKFVYRG